MPTTMAELGSPKPQLAMLRRAETLFNSSRASGAAPRGGRPSPYWYRVLPTTAPGVGSYAGRLASGPVGPYEPAYKYTSPGLNGPQRLVVDAEALRHPRPVIVHEEVGLGPQLWTISTPSGVFRSTAMLSLPWVVFTVLVES